MTLSEVVLFCDSSDVLPDWGRFPDPDVQIPRPDWAGDLAQSGNAARAGDFESGPWCAAAAVTVLCLYLVRNIRFLSN